MTENDIIKFNVDLELIMKRITQFSSFGDVYYPLKTNSNEELLKILIEEFKDTNNGFLVTHPSHFMKLRNFGVNPSKMCLVNVLADAEFVRFLYETGVRYFTFDNITEVKKFLIYASPADVKVSIRLSISDVFNEFSHLGTNVTECKNILNLLTTHGCNNKGISFYLQKEIVKEEDSLEKMLDFIAEKFKGFPMKFINIGGAKRPEEISKEKLEKVKKDLNIEKIILEPGRYLIGEAIDMETTVIRVKDIFNIPVIILKNGIYGGLIDTLLYNKKFDIRMRTTDGEVKLEHEKTEYADSEIYMCGASSDSGDKLGRFYINQKNIKELKEGTKLVIKSAGAYLEEFFLPLGGDLKKEYTIKQIGKPVFTKEIF